MKKQEYRYTTLWTEADDEIVFASYAPNLEIDIDVARELVQNRMSFCENKPHYILIDFTNTKSVTKEARDYMNSPEGGLKRILGGAFLSNSIVSNMLINLYLKINKPSVPAKFFTKKEEALIWLISLKKL
ncbi:MAG TPA: hypothetical protein VN698_01375 [Bacteroidia bacterium]|nr:hypothetical protein [Bacteroidia bacterium]